MKIKQKTAIKVIAGYFLIKHGLPSFVTEIGGITRDTLNYAAAWTESVTNAITSVSFEIDKTAGNIDFNLSRVNVSADKIGEWFCNLLVDNIYIISIALMFIFWLLPKLANRIKKKERAARKTTTTRKKVADSKTQAEKDAERDALLYAREAAKSRVNLKKKKS